MIGYKISNGSLHNYSVALSKVLDIPDTIDIAEVFQNSKIYGSHFFETNVITINKKFYDDVNIENDYLKKAVKLAYAIEIIAHEKNIFIKI